MIGFIEGTKILLADGTYENIENIVAGTKVTSFNENTKQTEICTVKAVGQRSCFDLTEYTLDDASSFFGCRDLKFLTPIGYVEHIEVGTEIITADGTTKKVIGIAQSELTDISTILYELDIDEIDNYIATESRLVVHNIDTSLVGSTGGSVVTFKLIIKESSSVSKTITFTVAGTASAAQARITCNIMTLVSSSKLYFTFDFNSLYVTTTDEIYISGIPSTYGLSYSSLTSAADLAAPSVIIFDPTLMVSPSYLYATATKTCVQTINVNCGIPTDSDTFKNIYLWYATSQTGTKSCLSTIPITASSRSRSFTRPSYTDIYVWPSYSSSTYTPINDLHIIAMRSADFSSSKSSWLKGQNCIYLPESFRTTTYSVHIERTGSFINNESKQGNIREYYIPTNMGEPNVVSDASSFYHGPEAGSSTLAAPHELAMNAGIGKISDISFTTNGTIAYILIRPLTTGSYSITTRTSSYFDSYIYVYNYNIETKTIDSTVGYGNDQNPYDESISSVDHYQSSVIVSLTAGNYYIIKYYALSTNALPNGYICKIGVMPAPLVNTYSNNDTHAVINKNNSTVSGSMYTATNTTGTSTNEGITCSGLSSATSSNTFTTGVRKYVGIYYNVVTAPNVKLSKRQVQTIKNP